MRLKGVLLGACSAALLWACTDESDSSVSHDWELDPCGFADAPVAVIDVSTQSDAFHGGVFQKIEARLRGAAVPSFHEVYLEEGSCRYYKSVIGVCDPPCSGSQFCTPAGECVPYPETISGGLLTITGLGDPLEIEPESWSAGTYFGPWDLPAELFQPGDAIGASLEGDVFPALALGAYGVQILDTEMTSSGFEMLDGQDAELTWTPGPDPEACVRVVLNGFNAMHGLPLDDIIVCEGSDTGSLTVPQAFVEEFPHGEVPLVTEGFDWPHSELTRYTRNSVETELGRAELAVRSTTYFQPSHPEP